MISMFYLPDQFATTYPSGNRRRKSLSSWAPRRGLHLAVDELDPVEGRDFTLRLLAQFLVGHVIAHLCEFVLRELRLVVLSVVDRPDELARRLAQFVERYRRRHGRFRRVTVSRCRALPVPR